MKTLHLSIFVIFVLAGISLAGIGVAYAYSSAGIPETHYPPTNDTKLELLVMNSTEFKERTTGYNYTLAGIDNSWIPKASNYYDFGGARVTFIVCCFANGTVKGVAFNLDPQLKIKSIFEYNADNPPFGYRSDTCHGCFLGAFNSTKPLVEPKNVVESPLKQFKSGIPVQDVKCKEGFVLIIKANGEPSCVKPNTATRLLAHGWITPHKFVTALQFQPYNNIKSATTYENATTSSDNNTRYPTESVPVHTSGPVGTTNVRDLPPIPKCDYSNYFCSMLPNSVTPLPPIPVTPTISSNSNITKIIAIGMSPNPLKVGDIPSFTITYQNISGKPIYGTAGCGSDLTYTISPDANIKKIQVVGRQCAIFGDVIQPNQTITDGLDLSYYKIIQQGLLNVTLTLNLSDNGINWSNSIYTIQFNVNAIQ